MRVSQDTLGSGFVIRAYAPGAITIVSIGESSEADAGAAATEVLTRSCAMSSDRLLRDWPPQQFADLAPEHFAALLELEPELVLFGSGGQFRFPAPELIAPLCRRGIGVEVMDTGAACRTYNVLAAEGRRVVAALLLD